MSALRFAVIGSPIAHSRSPEMHQAAYRALGIDATYERILVAPEALEGFVAALPTSGLGGVNVTLPHKERIASLVDVSTKVATSVGAVNCVTVLDDGRLEGDNTDAPGSIRALAEAGCEVCGRRCVVLGAGGAARAAVVGLVEAGAEEVVIAARRPDAAEALVAGLTRHLGAPPLRASGLGEELEGVFAAAGLLVQATSATLKDTETARTFAASLPLAALPATAVVTDLVYAPLCTTVLAAAEARGLTTVDGLGLLIHQGALSFERWLGRTAPIDVMRRAVV